MLDFCAEEHFNPDYVEVDRVLDASEHTDPVTKVTTKHYLVKWRSLSYEDCTWELEADVDPAKIEDFVRWKSPPDEEDWAGKKRPRKGEWKEMLESPVFKNGNQLRPYQLEGVNWLNFSWHNHRNCLLADEMGLGKTIQSLAWIHSIWNYGIRGPFLCIAPLSTIPNWQREFELWTDLNVIVYHGSQTSRNMIQEYEMYYKNSKGERHDDVFKFHVLITTYECVITDIQDLVEIRWRACVIDEAHRLKNQKCKLLEGLKLLDIESRLLLSGTPLQNNIHELYSLLSFLEPNQFNSQSDFIKEFGDMQNEEQVIKLQALLKPLMLRRMKEDVEKSLKPKEETIVEVELTNMQKKYYRGILEKNFSFLSKSSSNANTPNLMNTMMELRKCCIHPYLLNGAEEQIQEDYRIRKSDFKDEEDLYYKALVQSSGKMVLLDKLLPKLKAGGHRVLIFSQMVKMLDILEDYLIRKKYPFERIDGRIRGNLRQAAIDRYCRPDSDRFVFLLCTKAGGLGINLTAADTCIIYDSDWNPQNDLQAQARCHRIGQKKMVKIYRLVTRNTYEREMFDRAGLKLGLDKAVLQSMNTGQGNNTPATSNTLTKKEVEDLLKKGAYGALMDDDNAADKFCEEDIEDILLKRAQTVTHKEEAGSSFSKATFATSDCAMDIAIDDPDFWKKWAKKAEVEEVDETMKLMMSEPRSRKRIDRFGGVGAEFVGHKTMSDLDSNSDSDDEQTKAQKLMIKEKYKSFKRNGREGKGRRRTNWEADDDFMEEERDVEYGNWSKNELFRLEKGVMVYGWGRWEEVLQYAQLRKGWTVADAEDAVRLSLLYSLNTYKGDEKIKNFVWDLITPEEFGGGGAEKVGKNHLGLAAPVPRGRKGKKARKESKLGVASAVDSGATWVNEEKYDTEMFLDKNYRKHLERHNNKFLLRVRMLYYIQFEILGDFLEQINIPGFSASELSFTPPVCDGSSTPASWWDTEADKSLLVGVYRHGFERYNMMRLDAGLCFLVRCGPPDNSAVQAELENVNNKDADEDSNSNIDHEDDDSSSATPSRPASLKDAELETPGGLKTFPTQSDLNSRLRRLITASQRDSKKEEARQMALEKRNERRERIEQVIKEREKQKADLQQKKWSRREEQDFLRTIQVFGVEFSRKESRYIWDRFKQLSRLERKYDDTLLEYYLAFMAMCKRVAGQQLSEEEELVAGSVEAVSEERAKKVLERVDFLSKIREETITHPELQERLQDAQLALDLPEWWIPGKHDQDLLLGAARHGLARMEYYILNDVELSFKDVLKRSLAQENLVDKEEMELWEAARKQRKQQQENEHSRDGEDEKMDTSEEGKRVGKGKKKGKKGKRKKGEPVDKDHEESGENGEVDSANKEDKMETEEEKERLAIEKVKAVERAAVVAPQLNLQQMEAAIAKGGMGYDQEMINDLMAQTYAASIKWPRDRVLHVRLQHIVNCVETGVWPVPENFVISNSAAASDPGTPEPPHVSRDTSTPLSEVRMEPHPPRDSSTPHSEVSEMSSFDDGNVLTHPSGTPGKKRRGRRPLDYDPEKSSKMRSLLTSNQGANSLVGSTKAQSTDDSMSDTSGLQSSLEHNSRPGITITPVRGNALDLSARIGRVAERPGVEITPVNGGDDDNSNISAPVSVSIPPLDPAKAKGGSKLESALDKLGFQKRKLVDATTDDKSKKKKRLDDLLSGLHAGKGTTLPEKPAPESLPSPGQSLLRKDPAKEQKVPDLTKLQEMLGPLSSSPGDNKVQKWLQDQMGVTPDRPITPQSTSTSTGQSGKKPTSRPGSVSGGWMEWMSKLSGEEHVTVFNRNTGKKLSGTMGPKLKYLAQWLIENPMFEVDPKWAEVVRYKEPVADPKKKGPGRPPLDDPPAHKNYKMGSPSTSGVGQQPSYNSMASLGLDPKNPMAALAALDPKNPSSLSALYGLDPKKLDPMTAAMLGLGDPKNPMKMDPMMMAALGMDAKTLQAMGIDTKKLANMANPVQAKNNDPKAAPKTPGLGGIDPMLLAAFGMDPKNPKLDPMIAASLGLDPKNPKYDPMVLASLGLDPKNPNSTLLAAMAAMDPNNQLAAMYGMMPGMGGMAGMAGMQGMAGMAGMDLYGMKGKQLSPGAKDSKSSAPSPRPGNSRTSPSPRPPSRQSAGSREGAGGRSTPHSKSMSMSTSQSSPRTSSAPSASSMAGMFGGMNPALFGLDPKSLASMDPSLLQAAGIDPKMLQGLDPKMMAMLDPRMASLAGMDLKALAQMDPKLLQSAGIDPNLLSKMLDPKAMAGLDPKMFGMDPKSASSMAGLDPKVMASLGMDPKMLASMGMDSKMLASMGLDPKSLAAMGLDPKMFEAKSSQATGGIDPKILQSMGLDPRALQGIDPKLLAGMDPRLLSMMDPKMMMGLDPKMLGLDPKYGGISTSSRSGASTLTTSATSTAMTIPSSLSTPVSSGLDPRLLGLDPKMLQGLDEKALKSLGLDPNIVKSLLTTEKTSKTSSSSSTSLGRGGTPPDRSKSTTATTTTFSGLDPKMFAPNPRDDNPKISASSGIDAKSFAQMYGFDPKLLAGLDPKTLAAYGIDPKMLEALNVKPGGSEASPSSFGGMDPKLLGLDPKLLQGLDPKLLQSMGIDPKMLGLDGKSSSPTTSSASSSGMDPKMLNDWLAMAGIDPKMLSSMDPKTLAMYGIDSKMLASLDTSKSKGASANPLQGFGMDPMSMAGLDPKMLQAAGIDPKVLASMDPKVLASMGLDPKMLSALDPKMMMSMMGQDPKAMASMAGLDPKMLASMGYDPKMLAAMGMDPKMMAGLDPKSMASMAGLDPKMMASMGLDPKMLAGIDPKMLAGLDPKMLASMGIDPKMLASLDPKAMAGLDPKKAENKQPMTSTAGMDAKTLASMAGMDPKTLAMMAGMDPKLMASMGLDAKTLSAMGIDPKAMAAFDPKSFGMDPKAMAGMDPKMLASLGMDPKMLASMMDPKMLASMGMDPKMLAGLDPKMLASLGMDPKMLAGLDPKMLASMGMDPKMLAGLDPKMLASLGMDPKVLASMDPKMLASMGLDPKMMSDPNLMAMYAMGLPSSMSSMMPPMSMPSSMANGIGGTPLASSNKSSSTVKPKPGTVAAALQEKKENEKARSETSGDSSKWDNHDENSQAGDEEAREEEEMRRGLTSEERVLLREKKKERLMKEHGEFDFEFDESNNTEQTDEGLNLSVAKSPKPGQSKLEALLGKPISPPPGEKAVPTLPQEEELPAGGNVNNGEPPRTEGSE